MAQDPVVVRLLGPLSVVGAEGLYLSGGGSRPPSSRCSPSTSGGSCPRGP